MSERNTLSVQWRTSSHSGGSGTQCVQVAALHPDGAVAARDSKSPEGGTLTFSPGEWSAFLTQVKAGRFDQAQR
jgi:hypothetical protein